MPFKFAKTKVLECVSSNPIKDLVHELEMNEICNFCTTEKLEKQYIKTTKQVQYKRNREFIYTNNLIRRFYHYRDHLKAPRVTVCVLYDPREKMYHRGISICSYLDIVNKEEGRDIAEDRAIKALKTKMTNSEIDRTNVLLLLEELYDFDFKYKVDYNVTITNFEKRLFTPKSSK